ncbi:DUF1304 family protein [Streptomyces vietnamensis]|uniref:DUF1304 family protein n=1 Tax=Streptomyces vietnamensis TaxID=362257 RepID=UPI0037A50C8F
MPIRTNEFSGLPVHAPEAKKPKREIPACVAVGFQAKAFFLVRVAVTGAYGAATSNDRILFLQTVPALVALAPVPAAR